MGEVEEYVIQTSEPQTCGAEHVAVDVIWAPETESEEEGGGGGGGGGGYGIHERRAKSRVVEVERVSLEIESVLAIRGLAIDPTRAVRVGGVLDLPDPPLFDSLLGLDADDDDLDQMAPTLGAALVGGMDEDMAEAVKARSIDYYLDRVNQLLEDDPLDLGAPSSSSTHNPDANPDNLDASNLDASSNLDVSLDSDSLDDV